MNAHPTARSLDTLLPGESGEVTAIDHGESVGRRLMSLGLMVGCHLRVLQHAPLGDPIMVELPGCTVALRRRDARSVHVAVQ